jgi:transposase-like protein
MERVMKIQEVVSKAMAGKLKWWEAAEIIGVTDRTMRRWRTQYEEHGYSGCGITASTRRARSEYR